MKERKSWVNWPFLPAREMCLREWLGKPCQEGLWSWALKNVKDSGSEDERQAQRHAEDGSEDKSQAHRHAEGGTEQGLEPLAVSWAGSLGTMQRAPIACWCCCTATSPSSAQQRVTSARFQLESQFEFFRRTPWGQLQKSFMKYWSQVSGDEWRKTKKTGRFWWPKNISMAGPV